MSNNQIGSFRLVTTRALIARINRKLAADLQAVRTTRGAGARYDVGEHYIIDHRKGWAVETHVDLEDLGRELGVLATFERVA